MMWFGFFNTKEDTIIMINFLLFTLPVIAVAAFFWRYVFSLLFSVLCDHWYSCKFDGSAFRRE